MEYLIAFSVFSAFSNVPINNYHTIYKCHTTHTHTSPSNIVLGAYNNMAWYAAHYGK